MVNRSMKTFPLKLVQKQKNEATADGEHVLLEIHVPLVDGAPCTLGSGRYARVVFAQDAPENPNNYYAIKFLKRDTDSIEHSRMSRRRFFEEIRRTSMISTYGRDDFVSWIGFGYLAFSALGKDDREPEEVSFAGKFGHDCEVLAEATKEFSGSLDETIKQELQGPFYVMELEYLTLDDLLRLPLAVHSHAAIRYVPGLLKQLRTTAVDHRDDLKLITKELFNNAKPMHEIASDWADQTGMSLLNEIGKKDAGLRNQAILQLFQSLLACVGRLHSTEDPTIEKSYLAHRDLKPANFLMDWNSAFPFSATVKLADLGFAADHSSVRDQCFTAKSGFREPSALAPGTYQFRAPEQVTPGLEISFTAKSPKELHVLHTPDFAIREGDRFISSEVVHANHDKKHSAQETFVARIENVAVKSGATVVQLNHPCTVRNEDQTYYQGFVVRETGHHTDIFALGCILYFLASGGKNPENFYARCIESAEFSGGSINTQISSVFESCLNLTLAICVDDPEKIETELAEQIVHLNQKRDPSKETELARQSSSNHKTTKSVSGESNATAESSDHLDAIDPEFLKQFYSDAGDQSKWWSRVFGDGASADDKGFISNFCQSQRQNPATQFYCRDKNQDPIPFSILFIVVRMMLRDAKYSYVATAQEKGSFLDVPLHETLTKEVRKDVSRVLAAKDGICRGQLHSSNMTASDLFVLLRILMHPFPPLSNAAVDEASVALDSQSAEVVEEAAVKTDDEPNERVDDGELVSKPSTAKKKSAKRKTTK
ncbi:Protein kinase domain protein [Rubripirellula tenax]|uniref:non-specific serine/threonine protein kinase n=2 Tax=Rubripirellula tenax TaxID=2528015 RepID=A0A5C6FFT8_9BACT|nr:Protein kinase domain protein [Rubripirellula tenax]